MFHKEILKPETFALLESIMQHEVFDAFTLTGGTALALRLAHRYSDDLDLWTMNTGFMYGGSLRAAVHREIKKLITCEQRINDPLRSVFVVNETFKIDFILDQTPPIAPMDTQNGIRMFSLQDIAALKIDAVAGYAPRHNRKDFHDIYTFLSENIFSLSEMFGFFEEREGKHNFLDVLKNFLQNMALADHSGNPRLICGEELDWQKTKEYLKDAVRECIKNG
jgi:hypothetical protein